MSQAFLHAGEHGLVVAGFEIDHPIGRKARLGDGRCEQVGARDAPKDFALCAGGDARTEGSCCGTVDGPVTTAGYFMQRAESKAAARESRVHLGDSERKNRFGAPASAFDLLDLRAQGFYGGLGPQASC